MDDTIPLCPIAGWEIGPITAHGAITIKLDFLTNALQPVAEANQSPRFVLTEVQAKELASSIHQALQKLQSAAFQSPPGARH